MSYDTGRRYMEHAGYAYSQSKTERQKETIERRDETARAALLTALIDADHAEVTKILIKEQTEEAINLVNLFSRIHHASEALATITRLYEELSEIDSLTEVESIVEFTMTQAGIENQDLFDGYRQFLIETDSAIRDTVFALYDTVPQSELAETEFQSETDNRLE